METAVGIVKEVDRLGRIVIPKEYREQFGLTERVEIVATEKGLLLRSPEYKARSGRQNEMKSVCDG